MAPQYYESNGYGETVIEVERTPTCVFLRKNIRRVTETDEQGTLYTHWRYDEAKMTHADYDAYAEIKQAVQDVTEESDTQQILNALLGVGGV